MRSIFKESHGRISNYQHTDHFSSRGSGALPYSAPAYRRRNMTIIQIIIIIIIIVSLLKYLAIF
nr:hypothetical protein [Mesorhizobium soli]